MRPRAEPGSRSTVTPAVLLLAVVAAAPAVRAETTATERRIVQHVDEHLDVALDMLERSVNINSGTMNFDGVREVGALFRQEFEELGFQTKWIDGSPFERAGHLVARHGDRGPHLLLIGHLDTVFEPDSPFQRYEPIGGDRARGPGTTDMKGGNVIIIQALRALRSVGALQDFTCTVVLTGDEERAGKPIKLARAALVEAAEAADIALGFEDGDGLPETAVVARRGSTSWELRVSARTAHSSQVFREDIGPGAIFETARILEGFYTNLSGEKYLTFSPGVILGGTTLEHDAAQARGSAYGKNNVIAPQAIVSGDLRTISIEQRETAKQRMREIVAEGLPHTAAEISFRDGYPPLAPSEGNRRLLSLLDQVSRDLGFGPVTGVDPRRAGAADISVTSGLVEMALDGLGLMGTGGHTPDETADLKTLPSQTKRAAVLIYRLTRGDD